MYISTRNKSLSTRLFQKNLKGATKFCACLHIDIDFPPTHWTWIPTSSLSYQAFLALRVVSVSAYD